MCVLSSPMSLHVHLILHSLADHTLREKADGRSGIDEDSALSWRQCRPSSKALRARVDMWQPRENMRESQKLRNSENPFILVSFHLTKQETVAWSAGVRHLNPQPSEQPGSRTIHSLYPLVKNGYGETTLHQRCINKKAANERLMGKKRYTGNTVPRFQRSRTLKSSSYKKQRRMWESHLTVLLGTKTLQPLWRGLKRSFSFVCVDNLKK